MNTLRIASTVVAPDAESAIWFNASSTSSGCRPASFISVGVGSANTTSTGPREAKRATFAAVSRHRTRSTNRPASSVLTYTTTRRAVGSKIVSGLDELLDFHQQLTAFHRVTIGDVKGGDATRLLGSEFVLHLHGLEHDQRLPRHDLVAG